MEETNKAVVFRLVNQVLNGGNLDLIEDLYAPCVAAEARAWITPFRESFPDAHMDILQLIAEGDRVVGHFTCTATLTHPWLGNPPTGRRFVDIAEISIYRFEMARSPRPGRSKTI